MKTSISSNKRSKIDSIPDCVSQEHVWLVIIKSMLENGIREDTIMRKLFCTCKNMRSILINYIHQMTRIDEEYIYSYDNKFIMNRAHSINKNRIETADGKEEFKCYKCEVMKEFKDVEFQCIRVQFNYKHKPDDYAPNEDRTLCLSCIDGLAKSHSQLQATFVEIIEKRATLKRMAANIKELMEHQKNLYYDLF